MSLNLVNDVIKAERSQHSLLVEVLAQAFNNDPIMQYFYAIEEESRLNQLRWLSQLIVDYCQTYDQIYTTTADLKGAAVWLPPEGFPMNMLRLLRLGFYQFPFKVQWRKVGQFFQLFNEMEHCHLQDMREPHWYLVMLGVAPGYQGQGVGGALIEPILRQADHDGLPCYLETSTERGVNFYQKHGFTVLRSEQITADAPRFWTMKRTPQ